MGPFPHDAPPAKITADNPMGTDGFEFVEYAHPNPAELHALFKLMGYAPVARHRAKNITVYRQGDINYLVNEAPGTHGFDFVAAHGPCAPSMAFRVVDARQAYERALSLGAEPADASAGQKTLDVPAIKGIDPKTDGEIERRASDDEPLSMLAFKIMNDPFVGSLTFCRIYSGKVSKGTALQNTVKDKKERLGRMLQMHSNSREDIEEAFAGDIVALAGLKDVTTGDTLCDPLKPVILERMEFPEPVIEIAIEPKTKGDQEKMGLALNRLAAEDPSFRVKTDEESGQTIIAGMGELHLDILVDRMRREYKVEANIGAPQVAYRETITKGADVDYTHKKQTGGTGQFARIKIHIEPGEPGTGFVFESKIVGGSVPKEYVPGVQKGIASVMTSGPLAGFPMVDIKAELLDGAYHDVDSSVLAFEIASRAGFREAIAKAAAKLLEPVMKVEVVTPEDYLGDVIGDLNSRRGQIQGTDTRGNAQSVDAMVPLANMFGYVNALRSFTQGRANYSMQFSHYEEVPTNVADEVKAKLA